MIRTKLCTAPHLFRLLFWMVLLLTGLISSAGAGTTGVLVFPRTDGTGAYHTIVRRDLATGTETSVISSATAAVNGFQSISQCAWSHSGTVRWVLFQVKVANGQQEVWAVAEDGTPSSLHPVLNDTVLPGSLKFYTPALTRDDGTLAYVAGGAVSDLFIVAFNPTSATIAGTPLNLTNGAFADLFRPTWSPDGLHLAAHGFPAGSLQADIYRFDVTTDTFGAITGAVWTNLTNTASAAELYPEWSPALPNLPGGRIAFGSSSGIVSILPDGTSMKVIVNGKSSPRYPSWSPDGSQIAFTGVASSQLDVFVAAVIGGTSSNVTNTRAYSEVPPAWRP